jgi:hypothetical protein
MSEKAEGGQASKSLTELIGHALMDEQFRNTLFQNRAQATKGYDLTETDRMALDKLKREDLEQHAEVFGSASQVAVAIKIVVKGTF